MAGLEDYFVPKHDPKQVSSTDHSLQRRFEGVVPSWDQKEIHWPDEMDLDEIYHENSLSVAADMIAPEGIDETYVASQVDICENEHCPLDLKANTALGPENRIYTTSNNDCRRPVWSINARTDMLSFRPQRWDSLKTTKKVKNGKVWLRLWSISTCTTVVVWLNWT